MSEASRQGESIMTYDNILGIYLQQVTVKKAHFSHIKEISSSLVYLLTYS